MLHLLMQIFAASSYGEDTVIRETTYGNKKERNGYTQKRNLCFRA